MNKVTELLKNDEVRITASSYSFQFWIAWGDAESAWNVYRCKRGSSLGQLMYSVENLGDAVEYMLAERQQ